MCGTRPSWCEGGVILCNMGKPQRRTEPAAQEAAFRAAGSRPRPHHGDATVEGGDVCWIDERTLGRGSGLPDQRRRIRQLRELVQDCVDEVVVVPLPHWRGPDDVFHLMSMVSPIDRDLFLVYAPLIPVPFREGADLPRHRARRGAGFRVRNVGVQRPGGPRHARC